MKQSKIVALSMVLAMGLGSVSYADGTATPTTGTGTDSSVTAADKGVIKREVIDYNKALELMLVKNGTILSLEGQLKLQDGVIKEKDDEAKRYKSTLGTSSDDTIEDAKIVYISPIEARNTKNQLTRSLEDKKVELKEKLIKYHIDWKSYKSELALGTEVLRVQQKEYDNQALQFKLGKISAKDLATSNSNLMVAKSDLQTIKRKMDLLLLDYNVLISNSYQFAYEPDEKSVQNALKVGKVDFSLALFEKIKAANVAKDSALAKIQEEIPVIEEQKRLEHIYNTKGTDFVEYDKKIKENKDDYTARVLAIEYQVYVDYYTMQSLESNIESLKENRVLLDMQYKISEAQYKLGRATELSLIKAKKDLQDSEHKMLVAQYELYNAYASFTKNIGAEKSK